MDSVEETVGRMIDQLAGELNIPVDYITVKITDYDQGMTRRPAQVYCSKYKSGEPHETHWAVIRADDITVAQGQCPGVEEKPPHVHHVGCSFGSPDCPAFGVAYVDAEDKDRWWERFFRRG